MTRKSWTVSQERSKFRPKSFIESVGMVPNAMELRIRRPGWAKRITEEITSKCWGQFWTDTLGQVPVHDERWKADNVCHFMGKAVSR